MRDADGNWQTVTQYIRVERAPCHPFGGARPYFRCWCDRRVVKLYQLYRGYGFYRRRRCFNLAYECQREDEWGRALRAVGKIKARLGGDPNWFDYEDYLAEFPPKPRDMWWRTYKRLWHRHEAACDRAADTLERRAVRILRR